MKLKLPLSFIAAIVLFTACNTSVDRVKTQYHIRKLIYNGHEQIDGGITDTFYYTADGKRDYKEAALTSKEERNGNVIQITNYDKLGKMVSSSTNFLNEKGLQDSVVFRDATHITYTHKYIYDADGYVIEDRQYSEQPPAFFSKYKVIDGNRVEESMIHMPSIDTILMPNPVTGKMEEVVMRFDNVWVHKEYFEDKLNMPRNEHFGYTNADITSKNLEKKAVQLSEKGDTIDVFFFRYTFDDKGRVMSAAQIARSGEEYDSTAYTYY